MYICVCICANTSTYVYMHLRLRMHLTADVVRFVPSKHEAKQVVKFIRMIRAGKDVSGWLRVYVHVCM